MGRRFEMVVSLFLGFAAASSISGKAQAETKLKLLLFSTPWCSDCKREVPELHRLLKANLGEAYGDLDVTLFAETGKKSTDKPTEESAAQMAKDFKVDFKTAVDPWRWQTFKKYFPTSSLGIPASVVLDLQGNVLKACKPEVCPAKEVADFVVAQMTKPEPFSLYMVGEAANTDAEGKWTASSVYLIERRALPQEGRIQIESCELAPEKKNVRRTTLMKVTGNDYVVTDPAGSYQGTGSWEGKPWNWVTWKYAVKFPTGGNLEGNDELTATHLKMNKRYFDNGGKLLHTITGNFSLISQRAYQILKEQTCPTIKLK